MSAQDALLAAGVGRTGAETLRGRGAFVLVAGGQTTRLQSAYVSEEGLGRIADWARRTDDGEQPTWSLAQMACRLRLAK
jgi:hypothetical protein